MHKVLTKNISHNTSVTINTRHQNQNGRALLTINTIPDPNPESQ